MLRYIQASLLLCLTTTSANISFADVINAGVGGNRSHNLISRFERDVLSHSPSVVIIMVGTNDRLNSGGFVDAESYRKNVTTLIERVRTNGAKVLLVTPPPCIPGLLFTRHDPEKFADQSPVDRMNEVRAILIDLSKEQETDLVDFHQHLVENKIADNSKGSVVRNVANSGAKDGVHLTPAGYKLLATLIAEAFARQNIDTSKVVCFGDSLTQGSKTSNYPKYLSELLQPTPDNPP